MFVERSCRHHRNCYYIIAISTDYVDFNCSASSYYDDTFARLIALIELD